MIKKLKYYFIPLNPSSTFVQKWLDLTGQNRWFDDINELIQTLSYERTEEHPIYGQILIKPTMNHSNHEQYEPMDILRCFAVFADGTEVEGNYYVVDVNTNVWLNRFVSDTPHIDDSGTLVDNCISVSITSKESNENFKIVDLPPNANTITKIQSGGGEQITDYRSESYYDSSLKKLYILTQLQKNEKIMVCFSNQIDFKPTIESTEPEPVVESISGFDMSRLLEDLGEAGMVESSKRKGRHLIPLGRWVIFAIRFWIYLKIPTILGPFANRGPAWEPGQMADTIVDYYKQTVSGAFNIWGNMPDMNPGEEGMRQVLKAAFRLYFFAGVGTSINKDFLKVAEGLIRLSVMVYWFGAFLQKVPPPGSVQNIVSPVTFPGAPLVTPPTPNTDSAQMAMEFAFMFTIHSFTLIGFEIGMVPAGPSLVPVSYPFVAMI